MMERENDFFSYNYIHMNENVPGIFTVRNKESGEIFQSGVDNFMFNRIDGSTFAFRLGDSVRLLDREFKCITKFDNNCGKNFVWQLIVPDGLFIWIEEDYSYYFNKNFITTELLREEVGFHYMALSPCKKKGYIGIHQRNSQHTHVRTHVFDSEGNPINMTWKMYLEDLGFTGEIFLLKTIYTSMPVLKFLGIQ